MAHQAALNKAFADYARTIARRYEIGEVLYRLTDQVVEVLDVDGAGVSLADHDKRLQFVTATDEAVSAVEERQATLREGPCHDAYLNDERVTCADLRADERWPKYTPGVLEQGLRAVAGIPMVVDDQRIGALNLYAGHAREWDGEDLETAQLLADMATGYIVNARVLTEREELNRQLQHALDSRVVIEQAKGIVAERHDLDTAAAFRKIRSHARSENRNLHLVARDIVERTLKL